MPELIEVEYYRRALDPILGQVLRSVAVEPTSFIRPPGTPLGVFRHFSGTQLTNTRRHGKLLILELGDSEGPAGEIGLRFGMTGRLLVDGTSPIDRLEYSSDRNDPAWDRAVLQFDTSVVLRDQRRLGSIVADPDIAHLGSNVESIDEAGWKAICAGRRKSIKAVLLDQKLAAGLGNLLCDEVLWRCRIAPNRSAGDLDAGAFARLASEIPTVIAELTDRGGSHRGDSFALRTDDAQCSICGQTMSHATVATRSTWWCGGHQT